MKTVLPQVGKVYVTKKYPGLSLEVLGVLPLPPTRLIATDFGQYPIHEGFSGFVAECRAQFKGEAFDPEDEKQTFSEESWAAIELELADPGHCEHVASLSGNTLTLTDATRQHLEEVAAALDSTPQQVMERLIGEHLKTGRWLCDTKLETPDFDSPEAAAKMQAWLDEDGGGEIPFWPITNPGASPS